MVSPRYKTARRPPFALGTSPWYWSHCYLEDTTGAARRGAFRARRWGQVFEAFLDMIYIVYIYDIWYMICYDLLWSVITYYGVCVYMYIYIYVTGSLLGTNLDSFLHRTLCANCLLESKPSPWKCFLWPQNCFTEPTFLERKPNHSKRESLLGRSLAPTASQHVPNPCFLRWFCANNVLS